MEFCPNCANLLQFGLESGNGRFRCLTCPYVCFIQNKAKIKKEKILTKKEMDIIVSENDGLERMAHTEATCPNCHHDRAGFYEQQTRSADEPATLFFTCLQCKHKWNQ
uniref:DNA-directed RNA polymerase subunit n=1 Tax=Kalanchoe fedtschenkoi TaxID=63787 RepID=A0A7N0U076_KALFE